MNLDLSLSLSTTMKPCLKNKDKISQIPEPLLVGILSLLPTKDVIATSVLSKRWSSLWKMVPKLDFDYCKNQSEHEKFSEIVSKVLLSHKTHVLESLHLSVGLDSCDAIDIEMWIRIAYARHLRELVLNVESHNGAFTFPSSLCNCETLETLKLKVFVFIDVSSPVCLKSLRNLHLYYVDYKDDASVLNLLSGCPNLENLVVHRNLQVVKIFNIIVPSLQRLTIFDWNDVQEVGSYVINAPSLKYLKIQGISSFEFRLIEIASELMEANLIDFSTVIDEKLLGSLTFVKHLSLTLSPLETTFPTGTIFYQLVYMELHTEKAEWWNLLLLMLDGSPKLQILKLIGERFSEKERVACKKWNEPKNVSERSMLHLETFLWNGYKEQLEEEKEVATYILRNANHLKSANFSIKGLSLDERFELLEELESVVRASNSSCKLLFLS